MKKKDKDIIKKIEKNIIDDTKYSIRQKKIDSNEKLNEFINIKVINEIDKLYNINIKKVDAKKRREYLFNQNKKEEKIENKVLPELTSKKNDSKTYSERSDISEEIISKDINIIQKNIEKEIKSLSNIENTVILSEIANEKIIKNRANNLIIEETIKSEMPKSNNLNIQEDSIKINEMPVTLDDIINEQTNSDFINKQLDDDINIINNEDKLLIKEINKKVVEIIKEEKKEDKNKKKEINKKEDKIKEKKFTEVNIEIIIDKIKKIEQSKNEEIAKEELEDKEYEMLENKIDKLLYEIDKLKSKNISQESLNKLNSKQTKLLKMKDNINEARNIDIKNEEDALNESIMIEDINLIEEELNEVKLDHQRDLKLEGLDIVEQLNNKNYKEAIKIEKKLIYKKIKKAKRSVKINNLISSFFFKNKYLLYLTSGLVVSKNLSFIDNILKRTTEDVYIDITNVQKGTNALNKALILSKDNIEKLKVLESQIYLKHPELKTDVEFLSQINGLKNNLNKREERLNKKKKLIEKYNLNINVKKLKKTIPNRYSKK
ncbi:MAG: hypothetical protein E7158_06050 [Firmicutes bacterium]|nr:hypothetical protein [Bacillota bacterium]